MDDSLNQQTGDTRTGEVAFLERALWQRLTRAEALEEVADAWLRLQCQQIAGAVGGVVLLSRGGRFAPAAFWPDERAETAALSRAAEAVVERRTGLVQGTAQKVIAYPLMIDDEMLGAAIIDIGAASDEQVRLRMRHLQWGMGWLRDRLRAELLSEREATLAQARGALSLQATALVAEGFKGACRAVATELAKRLSADRVSIGARRIGRARVVAISHSANFGQKMSLVRLLAAAMDEAIDQRSAVLYPPEQAPDKALATRAHAKLASNAGAGNVLTVPLMAADHHFGAVVLERPPGHPFTQAEIDLVAGSVALLGPVFEVKRAEDRWIITKFAGVIGRHLYRLTGPSHVKRKIAAVALAALVAFFWYARAPYTVNADARLQGSIQRSIVAQFDGYIREAPFSAGDTVKTGDLMVAFDDRELALERLRWTTERQRQEIGYEQALAERDRALAQVARTQIEQSEAQIRLIDEQLARTRLTAPFAGLVVSGDLSQRIGSSASRGEILFEIAPTDDYRVLLQVDERQIDDVQVGQVGALVLTALPEDVFPIEVTKITPIAAALDGRNAFRVEARLDDASPRLRPGMEGLGKLDVAEARLIWIWTRTLIDWARLTIWRFWPES